MEELDAHLTQLWSELNARQLSAHTSSSLAAAGSAPVSATRLRTIGRAPKPRPSAATPSSADKSTALSTTATNSAAAVIGAATQAQLQSLYSLLNRNGAVIDAERKHQQTLARQLEKLEQLAEEDDTLARGRESGV